MTVVPARCKLVFAMLAATLLLNGCQQAPPPPKKQKAFRVASLFPPKDLHPMSYLQDIAKFLIYRSAAYPEWSATFDKSIKPYFLRSYKITNKGKKCLLNLRQDVYFHNGTLMTADDIIYTYQLVKKKGESSLFSVSLLPDISIKKVGRFEVSIEASKSMEWESFLTEPVLSAEYETTQAKNPPDSYRPMGAGPYRFVSYDENAGKMKLARFDKFARGAPRFGEVEIYYFDSGESATMALLNGEVDYLLDISPENARHIQTNPDLKTYDFVFPASLQLILNTRLEYLDDWRVRRALSLLIDREALVRDEQGMNGKAMASDAPFHLTFPLSRPTAAPADRQKAMELFAQAGWVRKKGKLIKDGKQFKIDIKISHNNKHYTQVLRRAIHDWYEAGVLSSVKHEDYLPFMDDLATGRFEAAFIDFIDFRNFNRCNLFFKSSGAQNFSGIADPEIDRLLERLTPGGSSNPALKKALQKRFREINPVITLIYPKGISAINREFADDSILSDPYTLYYFTAP